ncbi:MAG TPA: N-acetyl-gamma-glutamyl-phosphate reductase [Thermoanaerobaculia bacterium]
MLRVGIAGHTGYAGEELVALLRRHRGAEAVTITLPRPEKSGARAGGEFEKKALAQARQALRQSGRDAELPAIALADAEGAGLDAVLLATPVEASLDLVPRFLAWGVRVIDLSGAFRLTRPEDFRTYYGSEHPRPELLGEAVYGLSELAGPSLKTARLVANPGCHASAISLALAPLCRADLLAPGTAVVCDAKTGVSGAGKKATAATHFCAVSDNFSIYGAMGHRHVGEILQVTGLAESQVTFVAQILPVRRGILSTIYFNVAEGKGAADLAAAFERAYAHCPFVDVYPQGSFPNLESVVQTNDARLGFDVAEPGRRAVVAVAIDNLTKGAAGQAIQNLNLMFGLEETEGLL